MKDALTEQLEAKGATVVEISPTEVASKIDGVIEAHGSKAVTILYRRASDIEARPIHWLWPGRIAKGKVSMIAGNPGLGKSQVTTSMSAIVSTGGQWPVDRVECERGNVVILSGEDTPEDTIIPRLRASGADLDRVFIIGMAREATRGGSRERIFNLAVDLAPLGELLKELGEVALIVIDPITAYLGDTDSHKNAEVRALLAPLSKLAEEHRSAVVCVSHLNKGGASSEALMRVTGSLAFVAAARAAFIVTKDPQNPARRLFLPAKNNIGNDQTGLAFGVESYLLPSCIQTSRVRWEGDAVTVSADEALSPDHDVSGQSAIDAASSWLQELLADGPMSAKDVKGHAEQAGLSWATVRRAKDAVGIRPTKTRFDGGWEWALPSKVLKDAQDAQ